MSNLIVIGFRDQTMARDMRAALTGLQESSVIDTEDMVVVTRDPDGKIRLHQQDNLAVIGASFGSFLGLLVGMLFLNPPAGVILGMGMGSASGMLADAGINDTFIREVADTLEHGTSALFLLVRRSDPDKVLEALKPFSGKGRVLQTTLTREKEERLRHSLEQHADGAAS